jgi:hypothetical protein
VAPGVVLDVGPNLVPPREVRVPPASGSLQRRSDPGPVMRCSAFVVGGPVAADAIRLLLAVDVVACVAKLLERRDTGRTGADDAITGHRGCGGWSACLTAGVGPATGEEPSVTSAASRRLDGPASAALRSRDYGR